MKLYNLHTHCHYCDGQGEPEEYVRAAIGAGFHTLGFSSHAPVPFTNTFAIADEESLGKYCLEIRSLQQKYSHRINIFLGLEMDYIEGMTGNFDLTRNTYGLDYVIGSVHLVRNGAEERLWFIDGPRVESFDNGLREVFGGDIRKAVTAYYDQVNRMISTQKPDIVGHFDKIKMHNKGRYFQEDEPWYSDLIMETLENIKTTGAIVEVNTRGIYKKRSDDLYPGIRALEHMNTMNIPIALSADAHKPDEINGYYPEALQILRGIGFRKMMYFSGSGWKEQEL
jgi:histidinol-phosphatase (PHP family)